MNYTYQLESRSITGRKVNKYECPNCQRRDFVRYINVNTLECNQDETKGKCNRNDKCSYWEFPSNGTKSIVCYLVPFIKLIDHSDSAVKIYQDHFKYVFIPKSQIKEYKLKGCYVSQWLLDQNKKIEYNHTDSKIFDSNGIAVIRTPKQPTQRTHIPRDVLESTLNGYDRNTFVKNLLDSHTANEVTEIIKLYYLGTNTFDYLNTGITFPFLDQDYNCRAIQVKTFDEQQKTAKTSFFHSIVENANKQKPDWLKNYLSNDGFVSCLFGEHLLKQYQTNTIGIVEAPKTAIYCALHFGFPDSPHNMLWLSSYNLTSLNLKRCKVLKGRNVVLFPDLSSNNTAFDSWSKKAKLFNDKIPDSTFKVSDLLERIATDEDRSNGKDLADFLINQDLREFKPE